MTAYNDLVLTSKRSLGVDVSGNAVYSMEFTCTPGSTPSVYPALSSHIFVMNIVDASDTSKDTFARVATIADLDLLPNTREIATSSGVTQFRVAIMNLSFSDVDTALAAVPVLRDRVNNLVAVYVKAMSSYITPSSDASYPDSFDFPLGQEVQSVKATLIQNYRDARTTRQKAEATQANTQKAYEDAQVVTEAKREIREVVCTISRKFSSVDQATGSAAAGLGNALVALERAANRLNQRTRSVESGDVVGAANTVSSFVAEGTWGSVNTTWQVGDLVTVRWNARKSSSTPKTEIRVIGSAADAGNGNTTIGVTVPFTLVPSDNGGNPDTFTIRKFSDFFEVNDFSAISTAAESVRTSLQEYTDKAISVIATETGAAANLCTGTSAGLDTAISSELVAEEANNTAAVAVSTSLETETEALAKLVEYCPNLDVSTV